MSLEASLTPYSLKKLTFALACLSRFGEDVHIQAVKTELVLSSLNSSKTSYAQFTFSENFFESYEVEMATKKGVTCHLNAKALLGVFRSRGSLEKTAVRCDISLFDSERKKPSKKKDKEDRKGKKRRKVTDSDEDENDDHHGSSDNNNESSSSLSPSPSPVAKPPPSRLNIKFICNNGFIKTHSLFISNSHSTRRPTNNTEGEETSAFKVTPKHVSEWMEPFPGWTSQAGGKSGGGGGQKKEGYLAWTFGDQGVRIGTWEGNPRADRLSTEFAVEADEFDEFYLSISPVAFGFPMREFKAITFLATQLSVPISCVFTTPLAPLYVTLSHPDDVFDATFTIMTQEVPKSSAAAPAPVQRVKTEAEKARRRSAGMASSSGGVASGIGSKKKTLRMGNLEDGEQQAEEGSGSRTNGKGKGKGKGKERVAAHPGSSRRDGDGDQDMMDDADGNGEDQQQQEQEYLYPDDGGPAFDFAMDDFDPNQENQPPPPRHSTANTNNTPLKPRNGAGGGKPPNEEPLFFPNSQEQQQQNSPPRSQLPPSSSQQRAGAFPQSQLSQAQMEDLGLGDLEEMDWGAEDGEDDEEEVVVGNGNGKGKGKEREREVDRREEEEEVDPEKTDSDTEEEQVAAPRRESRVRVRESGKARRVEASESRSRSREARGGTAMTDEGDLRVPATLREDENRFMFDKSDDDDEDEEETEEDSSREVSREEIGGNGREMSPEL